MTNWIKKIELANFKSFKGKHVINFDKGNKENQDRRHIDG